MSDLHLRSSYMIVNDNGDIIMGSGRLAILESIAKTGSINQTAKELGMAYKTVWSKIKSTEKNFGKPVVIADKKSGTRLTDEGLMLMEQFRRMKKECLRADDAIFDSIFSSMS